jgi:hypothetical protein
MGDNEEKSLLDFHVNNISLPKPEDKLFTSQDDWWNNACIDWASDKWYIYSDGYKEAGDMIVNGILEGKRSQDVLVYPVIFLYRQYLELAMKGLLTKIYKLQDICDKIPTTHALDILWDKCRSHIQTIIPDDSSKELIDISRLIAEFMVVDPKSMAFRYPEDKNGSKHLSNIRLINLRNIKEVIEGISTILFGADAIISEYLDIKRDLEDYYSY